MSVTRPIHPLSISEYLKREWHSEVRHEYLHGEIFAMVGASVLHNLIASPINNRLTQVLSETALQSVIHYIMSVIDKSKFRK